MAFLIDGATASGKTAVYVTAVRAAQAAGRGALLLVPRSRCAAAHRPSAPRPGLRPGAAPQRAFDGEADEWRRLRDMAAVVGKHRLAVPCANGPLGVIVVDEEHDAAYKSDRTPLQARDVALELGWLAGAAVVLGSATPVSSASAGRAGASWSCCHYRQGGRLACTGRDVDLRAELAAGNRDRSPNRSLTLGGRPWGR
jgi:primosomal protein N' (replication factor Y)